MKKIMGHNCMVDNGRVIYINDNGHLRTVSRKRKDGWHRVCPSILGFCVGMVCSGYRLW